MINIIQCNEQTEIKDKIKQFSSSQSLGASTILAVDFVKKLLSNQLTNGSISLKVLSKENHYMSVLNEDDIIIGTRHVLEPPERITNFTDREFTYNQYHGDFSFIIRKALNGQQGYFSLESVSNRGQYLMIQQTELQDTNDNNFLSKSVQSLTSLFQNIDQKQQFKMRLGDSKNTQIILNFIETDDEKDAATFNITESKAGTGINIIPFLLPDYIITSSLNIDSHNKLQIHKLNVKSQRLLAAGTWYPERAFQEYRFVTHTIINITDNNLINGPGALTPETYIVANQLNYNSTNSLQRTISYTYSITNEKTINHMYGYQLTIGHLHSIGIKAGPVTTTVGASFSHQTQGSIQYGTTTSEQTSVQDQIEFSTLSFRVTQVKLVLFRGNHSLPYTGMIYFNDGSKELVGGSYDIVSCYDNRVRATVFQAERQ